MKERLDKVIQQRRIIRSRSRAQRMIEAGRVTVDGRVLVRPGQPIDSQAVIEIASYEQYVGRGGEKLAAALSAFQIDPSHCVCLDVGASTGGFTDCLLQHGASKVYAVDVGHGQLHPRLRAHPSVVVLEGINARYLEPRDIGEPVQIVTIDVSFISLRLVLPPLDAILSSVGDIVALAKPQFEAGKEAVPDDGVIRDAAVRQHALDELVAFIEGKTPYSVAARLDSPLRGGKGNVEVFLHMARAD